MGPRSQIARDQRGAAALEFALIAPLLVLLLFGIIEFGRVWSARNVYISAAREGARVAAVGGTAVATRARVGDTSVPYTPPLPASIAIKIDGATSAAATPCAGNAGKSVTVEWSQAFALNIAFFQWTPGNYMARSVFQCE